MLFLYKQRKIGTSDRRYPVSTGVPITTTAKRLGHTTSATTSKIYAHAINSADAMAATAIESILPRRRKNA